MPPGRQSNSSTGYGYSHNDDHSSNKSSSNQTYSDYLLVARPTPTWVLAQKSLGDSPYGSGTGTTAIGPVPGHGHNTNRNASFSANRSSLLEPALPALSASATTATSTTLANDKSRWNSFLVSTNRPYYGLESTGVIVDEKSLDQQYDFSSDWMGSSSANRKNVTGAKGNGKAENNLPFASTRYLVSEESRRVWKDRINITLLNNPYVPLTLRTIIFILSVAALSLACSIFTHSARFTPSVEQEPSTIMAICVQCCALVYLVYITYDEYSSKPIGLREPKAKMRLIMLDLLFIIFSSANLSLTFNTLFDRTWVCTADDDDLKYTVPKNWSICSRQKGLAAFLFMVLVMWVATFTTSIFRLVERVTTTT